MGWKMIGRRIEPFFYTNLNVNQFINSLNARRDLITIGLNCMVPDHMIQVISATTLEV